MELNKVLFLHNCLKKWIEANYTYGSKTMQIFIEYQLREICKDIKRYKESAGVMNQMVSLGVEMGE